MSEEAVNDPKTRLDCLLSVALDDELDAAEAEELTQLRAAHPELAATRAARFSEIGEVLGNLGSAPHSDAHLESGLAALRARLGAAPSAGLPERPRFEDVLRDEVSTETKSSGSAAPMGSGDELARRRFRASGWGASLGLAAAAAIALYFVVPAPELPFERPLDPPAQELPLLEDPIALALVFDLAEESLSGDALEDISFEDLEIIEQLDLLEYMAAHETEGRG
jgi:hypothetical protein